MKTTKEMIEVMQAFDDGHEIYFMEKGCHWKSVSNPTWNWRKYDYRINWSKVKINWPKVKINWAEVEIDTKVLVKDSVNDPWEKKHFAVFNNGFVHAYIGGMTSFSSPATGILKRWKYAKLWTS